MDPGGAVPGKPGSSPPPPPAGLAITPDTFEVGRRPSDGDLAPVVFSNGVLLGELQWLVPTAILGLPGLLILIAIVVQVLLGVAWIRLAGRAILGRAILGSARPRGPAR